MSDTAPFLALTITGASGLMPVEFRAEEAISAPFSVSVDVVTSTAIADPGSLLFQPACLTVQKGGQTRYFNGMVRAVTAQGLPVRGYWRYNFVVVPKLWFMGQTSDCRIFQVQSVCDIITTICGENGQALSINVYGDKTPLDYVTQYNETDLRFISRLMEQAGYFYFFQHTKSAHTLVVTDQNQGFPASPKPTIYVIHAGDNLDVFSAWRQSTATALGKVTLLDYDPSQTALLDADQPTTFTSVAGASQRDVTRWPALTYVGSDVSARAAIDIAAAEAEVSVCEAEGTNASFAPGGRFTLAKDPVSGATSIDYIVRSVSHTGSDETWVTGTATPQYGNALTAFPVSVPWQQPLTIARPVMAGIFAATVLGDSGEEIHVDDLARIKARMMWDHRQETVADKGVWMRVITPWAGNSWGFQHHPRVGTEVAVAFMDGDPDRPVVVGGFYNASMAPIFPTSQENKNGFRSRSTKDGATANFSEFSFDDTKGSELVYLHAERDMTREVENNDSLTVNNAQTITVDQGRSVTIKGKDDTLTVTDGNHSITVSQGNQSNTVSTGNFSETVSQGNHSTTVSAGNLSTTVSQGNHSTTVSMGNLTISVSMGSISISAMQGITLTCGSNSVQISPSGVTINGMQVQLQGTAQVSASAPIIQVSADGMLQMQGGIVMIN